MKNDRRMLVSMMLLVLLLPAAAAAEDCRGIGGTGRTSLDCGIGGTGKSMTGIGGTGHGGIGGTGSLANKAGIGGTGHSDGGIGGTGIVGTITGFGSIWVNGLEVDYDAKTKLLNNESTANANELAVGQIVVVEASGDDKRLKADKITVIHAVDGEISSIDAGQNKLTVLGQSVNRTAQTVVQDRQTQQSAIQLKQGEHVKVSGLRMANGQIVASRIDRTGGTAESGVVGPITAMDGDTIQIYDLKIRTKERTGFKVGQEILAKGRVENGVLNAAEVILSPVTRIYGRTERINLQGYVGSVGPDGQVRIGELEVIPNPADANRQDRPAITPGELIQISGRFSGDHRVIADRIEISRDRPERTMREGIGRGERNSTSQIERSDRSDHSDHSDRSDRADRADRSDRSDRADRAERSDHADRPDKPDRSEHSDAEKHSDKKH